MCRESERIQSKTVGGVLSYDEIIEGPGAVAFPEELDFRFEVTLTV